MLIPELDDVVQTFERNAVLVREMAGIIVQAADAQDAIMGRINGLMRYAQGTPLDPVQVAAAPQRAAAVVYDDPAPQTNGNHYPGAENLPAWGEVLRNINSGEPINPPPVPQRTVAAR